MYYGIKVGRDESPDENAAASPVTPKKGKRRYGTRGATKRVCLVCGCNRDGAWCIYGRKNREPSLLYICMQGRRRKVRWWRLCKQACVGTDMSACACYLARVFVQYYCAPFVLSDSFVSLQRGAAVVRRKWLWKHEPAQEEKASAEIWHKGC